MENGVFWVESLSALLVPLIACMTLLIAYRQWRTAQNKLKLDLFDKRLAVYEGVTSFVARILISGKVSDDELGRFLSITKNAKWLFSDEVANYLHSEIYKKAKEIQKYEAELKGVPVSGRRTALKQEQDDAKTWIGDQFSVIDQRFKKYMKISH